MQQWISRRRVGGVAALAVLVLLAGLAGAAWFGHAATTWSRPAVDVQRSRAALVEARAALLGYAAAYPDRVNVRFGPGYLPCPARRGNGIAASACSDATASTLGHYPWHTLRSNDLRDASGARLWYAVAHSHRYNPKTEPMHWDVPASLAVDGGAAVAVLLAPGASLPGQDRRERDRPHPRDYLELDFNTAGAIDTAPLNAAANDEILVLTRAQLMQRVEARVAGDLREHLLRYRAGHGGHYPWLLPAGTAPGARPQRPGLRTRGRLPVHVPGAPEAVVAAPEFATDLTLSWQLDGLNQTLAGPAALLPPACLVQSPCVVDGQQLVLAGDASCRWWSPAATVPHREVARCSFEKVFMVTGGSVHYTVTFALVDSDGNPEVSGPNNHTWRTRRVITREFDQLRAWPDLSLDIYIELHRDGAVSSAALSAPATAAGWFSVANIRYALDVEQGELPAWLVHNDWLSRIHLAWAQPHCASVAGCFELASAGTPGRPHGAGALLAALLAAGPALPTQSSRTPAAPRALWFEGPHASSDPMASTLLAAPAAAGFNDRVYILEALP